MTARILCTRVDEHVLVSYRTAARLTQQPLSTIGDHSDICDTPFEGVLC